jgi:hypothetical protein
VIRVVNKSAGVDLTGDISGLRYSNVRPGGDETANFTYHAPWALMDAPAIDKGSVIEISEGLDVLWKGRIEELAPGGDQDEEIAVTAYGLGVRGKDSTFQEIYIDRDANSWGTPTWTRQKTIEATMTYSDDISVMPAGDGGDLPGLLQVFTGAWATASIRNEAWYDAKGISIGAITYGGRTGVAFGGAGFSIFVYLSADSELVGSSVNSGDIDPGLDNPFSGTLTGGSAYKWGLAMIFYNGGAGGGPGTRYAVRWSDLLVRGNHGLTLRSSMGYYASDVIRDIVNRIDGITARKIDETTFIVEQLHFKEPTVHEDGVVEANKFNQHERTWGTWGPDSIFDASDEGYFDYTDIPATADWYATRGDCDGLDLATETANLYNRCQVFFQDTAGVDQVVTRTRAVPELDENGITRTLKLDLGTSTTTLAQQLGDVYLALFGGFAPSRGTATLSRPIRHVARGKIDPWHLRADGSAIQISDILPTTTLFEMSAEPDRRATFPIKRVEVDCSGDYPTVNVDLDQTPEVMDALLARLQSSAEILGV